MAIVPAMFAPVIEQIILLLCGYMSFKSLEGNTSEAKPDLIKWLTVRMPKRKSF
jgi:hypothetical protein